MFTRSKRIARKEPEYLYFAYGSNMLQQRIEERVGKVEKVGPYKLYGWRLAFNCGYNRTAYANARAAAESKFIEGVLYKLTWWQRNLLDSYEVVPINYTHYDFVNDDGEQCFMYVATRQFTHKTTTKARPLLYYINLLLDGCVENNLDYTYDMLLDYKKGVLGIKNSRHKPRV
jgi:hypothetical protein